MSADPAEGSPDPAATCSGGVAARRPDPVAVSTSKAKQAWAWWMTKAIKIARTQNRVLGWLAYYIGLGPVGLILRRGDRLDRAKRPAGASAWNPREEPISVDPMRIKRPF